jgi:hypothetical protein
MKVEEVLEQVMLELLYPAVLGTVLFFALEITGSLFSSLAFWRSPDASFGFVILLKCLLLYVTVLFYGCDYAYIILTPEFQNTFLLVRLHFSHRSVRHRGPFEGSRKGARRAPVGVGGRHSLRRVLCHVSTVG